MKYYTFFNLTASVRAEDGKEAYTKLCDVLDKLDGDWHSSTYSEDDGEEKTTEELFPTV